MNEGRDKNETNNYSNVIIKKNHQAVVQRLGNRSTPTSEIPTQILLFRNAVYDINN